MYFTVTFCMYLSLLGGVCDGPQSFGLGQAWSDPGPLKQRKLLQDTSKNIRLSMAECDPQKQDCSGKERCMDMPPPDSDSLECADFALNGLCDRLEKEFCAISCGFCCSDEQPNYVSCEEAIQLGLCEKVLQEGKCKKTCGECSTGEDGLEYDPWEPVTVIVRNVSTSDVDTGGSPAPPRAPPTPAPTPTPVPTVTPAPPLTLEMEANALLAFQWNSSKPISWRGFNPCDNWQGISCENNRVTKIQLFRQKLQGTLPPQLSIIKSLEWISVYSNSLIGTLPQEYSQLTSLTRFHVYGNSLTGTLPQQYSKLVNLEMLWLNYNAFTGTLPPQYSVLNLDSLHVHENSLSGTVPPSYSEFTYGNYGGNDNLCLVNC